VSAAQNLGVEELPLYEGEVYETAPSYEESAFHEAGHAVAATVFFGADSVEEICISPAGHDAEIGGECWYSHSGDYTGHRRAIVLLAGPAAEARACRRPVGEVLATGGSSDLADLGQYLWILESDGLHYRYPDTDPNDERCREQRDALCRAARRFVARHWFAIQRVAAELEARGRLRGSEIAALIAEGTAARRSAIPVSRA
jgi:hypothetical protein